MQYIVKENNLAPLGYNRVSFEQEGYVAELNEEELEWGIKNGYQLEMDHRFKILEGEHERLQVNEMISFIKNEPIVFAYFEKEGASWERAHYRYSIASGRWKKRYLPDGPGLIICCSAKETFLASDYLKMTDTLHELACALKKKLIIWENIASELPYYRRNSVTQQIMYAYMNKYQSLYLLPTNLESSHKEETCGRQLVWKVEQAEAMIVKWLGKRKKDDLQSRSFSSPLSKKSRLMVQVGALKEEGVKKIKGLYQGQKVWIGILTDEHGHYQRPALLDEQGKMRVVGVWDKEKGKGSQYIIGKQLKYVEGENTSLDHLMDLIGGKETGLAAKAQFVIGKVKKQSNEEGVYWEDLKEAAERLAELAKLNGHFLVLVIPYESYLLPDQAYSTWLEQFAKSEGHMVIVPAGDRGDKGAVLSLDSEGLKKPISFMIKKSATVVGQIMLRHSKAGDFYLIDPSGKQFLLKKANTLDEVKLYIEEKAENEAGEQPIYLSMENLKKGKWQLQMIIADKGLGSGQIILQTPAQHAIWFCSAKGQGTLSQRDEKGLISVGCFQEEMQLLYGYSGRGDRMQYPTLVVSDALSQSGSWQSSLSAVGVIAGAMAALAEKMQKEDGKLVEAVLKKRLLWELMRMPDKVYPDYGQGYGILKSESITRLLGKEQ